MTRKQGDTHPPVTAELDTEASLENATVYFRMEDETGATLVNSVATIEDIDTGAVSYQFDQSEVARVGTHNAEWVIEWPDPATDRETYPSSGFFEVEIIAALDRDAEPVSS